MTVKQLLSRNLINTLGWRTKRKIVVIESDDWGSIRMPSKAVYEKLLKQGYHVDQCPYCRYDSLASEDDLSALFDVLSSITDIHGNHPVVTANTVVANPDFNKIKTSGFSEYSYELFPDTLNRYSNHSGSFELWKQGMAEGVFRPQFHAREHLNVSRWMRDLKSGVQNTRLAFGHEMISVSSIIEPNNKNAYMDSFDYDTPEEAKGLNDIAIDGLKQFKTIFGYNSKSFIASCYIWGSELEKSLSENGVEYLQGLVVQSQPTFAKGTLEYNHKYHYIGQKNSMGQAYLMRNCFFEPSQDASFDWIGDCMNRIETAFRWGKPATISIHRLNFIGSIDEGNRTRSLILFKELLDQIVALYPDVEFMSSDQLGDLITNNK